MREVVEIWLRLQIGRKNVSGRKKCRESALIKPLSLSIWAAEENLNRVHQASRCCKFGCKKTHVVFEQLELNFKKQKKTSWLVAKMKESYCVQGRTLGGGLGLTPPLEFAMLQKRHYLCKGVCVCFRTFLLVWWQLSAKTTEWFCMKISRNTVNGSKRNNHVLVGIWVIACIQEPSHHVLQTSRRLRIFMLVLRDSLLYS